MKKNYTTYTVLDFAQDDWFIKWIKGNAKAALFAIDQLFEERNQKWPVMVSGTITDAASGNSEPLDGYPTSPALPCGPAWPENSIAERCAGRPS